MTLADIESKANSNYLNMEEIEDIINNPPWITNLKEA